MRAERVPVKLFNLWLHVIKLLIVNIKNWDGCHGSNQHVIISKMECHRCLEMVVEETKTSDIIFYCWIWYIPTEMIDKLKYLIHKHPCKFPQQIAQFLHLLFRKLIHSLYLLEEWKIDVI